MLTHKITDAGINLSIVGDCLSVTSFEPLTEEQRKYIQDHKPALLDELRDSDIAATEKLQQIAQEQDWPISDLLGWYRNDFSCIPTMKIETVRAYVADYIKNIELNRGEGYQLPCNTPPALEPVQCAGCQHFIPDPIGGGGIGDCNQNIKQRKPYWPNAKRMCGKWKAKQ